MAIKIAGQIEKSFYNSTKLTKAELKNIAKTASQTSGGISGSLKKGMGETKGIFEKIKSAGKKAFKALAVEATTATAAVGAVLAPAVNVGSSFEAQMSTVQAISGATGSDLVELKDKAKEMGATTAFSATEAGEAMEYMAMAGWKSKDMVNGIDGIMDLAAASGEDLGTTSDIVTDALTAFKMQAKDAGHFSDILAEASSNANTNVSMMGETFKYVAPLAGSLGYSAEDTALAIGLMANSGIKASNAGTALRSLMSGMAKPTKESSQAMENLCLSLTDSEGKMKTFSDVLYDIRSRFEKLTESEKAEYAAMLAGKTGMSGLLAIVNASDRDLNKLFSSIENCNGAAERMADTRLDNFNGDVTILKSGLEGLGIQIYDDINGPLRQSAQFTTEFVSNLSSKLKNTGVLGNFVDSIEKKIPTAVHRIQDFSESVIDFSEPVINLGEWLLAHLGIIVSTIVGIGTALTTYRVASNIMKLSSALTALSPAGAAVLGVASAITAVSGIATYIKLSDDTLKRQNLAKHFGEISLSMEELSDVAEYIVDTNNLESIKKALEAIDDMGEMKNSIDDSIDSINKMNWKVSIGMSLTNGEKESYISSVDSYVSGVQNLLTQKQYAVSMSVGVLMTDDGIEKNNVVDKINNFYADKQKELETLGKKLNKAVTDAFQDGLLDVDEVKEITQLQKQMADIQSKVAGSKFDSQLELLNLEYSGGKLDADSFKNLQNEVNKQVKAATSDYDDSLTLSISNAKVMLDEGAIDKAQYDSMVKSLKEGYLEQIGDIQLRANNFQLDTIKQQYSTEITKAMPELKTAVDAALNDATSYLNDGFGNVQLSWDNLLKNVQNYGGLDDTTKNALSSLVKEMQPSTEELMNLRAKYQELGMEVPAAISKGITDASAIGAISGNANSIWTYVGQAAGSNPSYSAAIQKAQDAGKYVPGAVSQGIADSSGKNQISKSTSDVWNYVGSATANSGARSSAIQKAQESGRYIPTAVGNGISANKAAVSSGINSLHVYLGSKLDAAFRRGYNVNVPVNLNPKSKSSVGSGSPKLPGHATGGIFNVPHIAWFAEDGPEAAIPLDGSKNAIDLWTQTGKLLGMTDTGKEDFGQLSDKLDGNTSTNNVNNQNVQQSPITYSPVLNFYGDAPSKDDVTSALDVSEEKFERLMRNWIRQNGRLSFS